MTSFKSNNHEHVNLHIYTTILLKKTKGWETDFEHWKLHAVL